MSDPVKKNTGCLSGVPVCYAKPLWLFLFSLFSLSSEMQPYIKRNSRLLPSSNTITIVLALQLNKKLRFEIPSTMAPINNNNEPKDLRLNKNVSKMIIKNAKIIISFTSFPFRFNHNTLSKKKRRNLCDIFRRFPERKGSSWETFLLHNLAPILYHTSL